jgi:sugar phosphate isomerase/epimerase
MPIKLSISSYVAGKSPETAVKRIAKAGFRYAEMGSEHSSILVERSPEAWKTFRNFAEDQGVRFGQGHLLLHKYITEKDDARRRANVETHKLYCRMYHAVGITSAVLHCGGYDEILRGEDPAAVRAIRVKSLTELLSDLPDGMSICLENLPYETFEDVYANLEAMGFPHNLGLCLDTGHLHFCPKPDHEEFILRAGKHLKALHMHDNVGPMHPDGVLRLPGWIGSDKHMAPGFFTGSINWYRVVAALRTIGYDRLWNMEIGGDLGDGTPNQAWRDMVLRHDFERAQLIFNYDPEAPAPDDPVNDYAAIGEVSSKGVKAEVDKYMLKVTSPEYTLKVDPVHGGRVAQWRAFDRELLARSNNMGWGVVGNWCPASAAFNLSSGMKIESVKAVDEGIELLMTKVLGEDDNAALAGVTYEITDTFGAASFKRKLRIINTTENETIPFSFRFHNMPSTMGGAGLPTGSVTMDDGVTFERCKTSFCFRIGEQRDAEAEKRVGNDPILQSSGKSVFLSAPDMAGKLHVTFPGVLPAIIYCWDPQNNAGSCEAIFESTTLKPGEECAFEIAVKHCK